MHVDVAEREVQVERQLAHVVLRLRAGVRERPAHRALAQLAVVLGDIRAAAIVEVAGDRVVVVSVDRRDLPFGDQLANLVGVRAVAHEIAAAKHALDPELLDPRKRSFKRRQVAVDVGDNRRAFGLSTHVTPCRRATRTRRGAGTPASCAARASTRAYGRARGQSRRARRRRRRGSPTPAWCPRTHR